MNIDLTNGDPTLRDEALRSLLVSRAHAAGTQPRTRMTRRAVIATIAAFTLAGGLAGGAVSAVALTGEQSGTTVVDVNASSRDAALGDAEPLGTPFTYAGTGDAVLELGTPPEGTTHFIYSLRCLEAGTFVTLLDNDERTRATTICDEATSSSPYGGGGTQHEIAGGESHSFTIQSSAKYSIWGTWVAEPTPPTPSAAQTSALADEIVTREEYLAGYERFSACMSEAGFPLAFVDQNKTVIEYSTTQDSETDGASPRCYVREFQQIDMDWQIANQDTSESAEILGECLTTLGITPAPTMAEKLAQLETAGKSPADC